MNTSRFARVLVLFLLVSPALFAAEDVTGKWAGSFVMTAEGQSQDLTVHMVAKQTGVDLTGTIGPNADQQWPILKGKIQVVKETVKETTTETTKLTFDVAPDGGTDMLHVALTLVDGKLKGTGKGEHDGKVFEVVLDMARIK